MKAVFVSKNSIEYGAYEIALDELCKREHVGESERKVKELCHKKITAGCVEADNDAFGVSDDLTQDSCGDGETLGDASVSIVYGKYILLTENTDENDFGVVVLNGDNVSSKQSLRNVCDDSNLNKFISEIHKILDLEKLSEDEMCLFVHLGEAGDINNVIEIEQKIEKFYDGWTADRRIFAEIKCLSSMRNSIFRLDAGMICLPANSEETLAICERIDFSLGIDDLLTMVSLQFTLGKEKCIAYFLKKQQGKNDLEDTGSWLKKRLSRIQGNNDIKSILEPVIMLCNNPCKANEILKDYSEQQFIAVSAAIGKLLRKEV